MSYFRSTVVALTLAASLPALTVWAHDASSGDKEVSGPAAMFQHHHEGVLGIFKQLRQDLKLTPEQSTALDKVVKNVRDQHEKGLKQHEEMEKDEKASLTAVQRMEKHVQWMDEHSKEAKSNLEDFKQFYGTLKADQQKKVDEVFAKMHAHHHDHAKRFRGGPAAHQKLHDGDHHAQQPAESKDGAASSATPAPSVVK